MNIVYCPEPKLSRHEFIDILERSGLSARRPVNNKVTIDGMLSNASLVITARDASFDNRLIGVSRCVTDFTYCCYCSDLAVDQDYQGKGIGTALIDASREKLATTCSFFLISAPQAVAFYERINMHRIERVFGWLQAPVERGNIGVDRGQ